LTTTAANVTTLVDSGLAAGTIIATITTAHIRNTRTRSQALQCCMAGMMTMFIPTSIWRIPQSM